MGEMVVSFTFFAVATFLVICVHRMMRQSGRRTLAIFLAYPIGLIALGVITTLSDAAMIVYSLLSLLAFILLITPVLGDAAPTSRIITFLRTHRLASYRSIIGMFSNTEMIQKRLRALVSAGLIRQRSGRYTATMLGRIIAWCINRYLWFLSWELSV